MRTMMETRLGELMARVGADVRRDVLASSVVFPRTESLQLDRPITELTQEKLDLSDAILKVRSNAQLVAISARDDLVLILEMLKELQEELVLDAFDQIQIYRGGLDILRIVNKSANSGRSAFVEVNNYRRQIQALLVQSSNSNTWSQLRDLMVVGVVAYLIYSAFRSK